jgi:hypothetical protein
MAKRWIITVLVVWLGAAAGVRAQMPPPPLPDPSTYLSNLQYNAFGKQPTTADLHFNAFACPPGYDQSLHGAIHAGLRDQAFLGPKIELDVDYLLLFIQPPTLPPVLTTGSILDPVPGALGQPNTRILDVGEQEYGPLSGIRLRLNWPIIDQFAVSGGFFISEQASDIFDRSSDATGDPLLARPFFDLVFDEQQANRISEPGALEGTTHRSLSARILGAETIVRWSEPQGMDGLAWSIFGGFNYLRFDEAYFTSDVARTIPAGSGDNFAFEDHFSTSNRIYGGQLGAQLDCCFPDGVVTVFGKVTVGAVEQNLTINGKTTRTEPDGTVTIDYDQGLYAQPTNTGTYDRWRVSTVPEFGINLAYCVHPRVRISVGYTFMYLTNVIRPADQIDQRITVQPLFGGALIPPFRPVIDSFDTTNIWVQYLNFGVGVNF